MTREDEEREVRSSLYAGLDLFYTFAGEQAAFLILGWLLDRYAGTGPWGLAGFGFVGTWVSLYHLLLRLRARENRRSPPPPDSSPPSPSS